MLQLLQVSAVSLINLVEVTHTEYTERRKSIAVHSHMSIVIAASLSCVTDKSIVNISKFTKSAESVLISIGNSENKAGRQSLAGLKVVGRSSQ